MFSSRCFTVVVYFRLPVVAVAAIVIAIVKATSASKAIESNSAQVCQVKHLREKAGHMIITEEPTA